MALRKTIRGGSNLPLSYHRIAQIIEDVNVSTGLLVKSYLNEGERVHEKESGEEVFSEQTWFMIEDYVGPMTVQEGYTWLKSRDEYNEAEDVFESEEQQAEAEELAENIEFQLIQDPEPVKSGGE